MASVNKVVLVGNLGADPEMRYTSSGAAIANVSIATTDTWKDKQTGEKQERTEWHRVVFFNRLAEIVGEYLSKGRSIYIEGRLQTRKWQDQNGTDRWTTEVVASEMQMLGGGERNGNSGGYSGTAGSANPSGRAPAPASQSQPPQDFNDDIPF